MNRPSWGWVLLGVPAAALAMADGSGVAVWHGVGWALGALWGLPYVATTVTIAAALAALPALIAIGMRIYRRWGW